MRDALRTLRAARPPVPIAPIEECMQQLLAYVALLRRWNTAFNLVGRSDVHRLVERHLVDALQLGPVLQLPNLLDIGSGAGLPGMVLAIVFPELSVTLLERAPRRARFLTQTQLQLKLPNLNVVNGDATIWRTASGFATVTARAVASGELLGEMVRPHLASAGVLVAQFGALQDERHIPPGFAVLQTREYRLPDNSALYRLLVLRNALSNISTTSGNTGPDNTGPGNTRTSWPASSEQQGTPRG